MRWIVTVIIALLAGFAGAAAWEWAGLGPSETREYLLAHPEVLPEAIDELQRRDTVAKLAPLRGELETAFPGAVLGNPDGAVTLVEFSDYACGYCRQSVDDVNALVAANPDLKVVIREYPILSEGSVDAARMALAAAGQGKFEAFHNAMFTADSLSAQSIANAARAAGVDLARARAAIDSGAFDGQLQNNVFLAQQLGVGGTPAFIAGDRMLAGAVGQQALDDAVAAARES
ncbi:DsbA family protein [Aurantiacibacter spongiae]|uniref:DsbA family protein n=1 Tax=Aurantiacibacter spongiae TaxID=2488860 RepID=A0A3N5CQX4_9SPHN|nr:DsbA family protein [Aurantiacibacter spongiae]RPF71493.1 DsbA family protein [Aurantiacibacter spongiae]